MSTHGLFILKDGDYIWGFHFCSDGYNVIDFYEQNKDITNVDELFRAACLFFAEEKFNERSYMQLYRESYRANTNYSNITHYTVYFDSEHWHINFEEEE